MLALELPLGQEQRQRETDEAEQGSQYEDHPDMGQDHKSAGHECDNTPAKGAPGGEPAHLGPALVRVCEERCREQAQGKADQTSYQKKRDEVPGQGLQRHGRSTSEKTYVKQLPSAIDVREPAEEISGGEHHERIRKDHKADLDAGKTQDLLGIYRYEGDGGEHCAGIKELDGLGPHWNKETTDIFKTILNLNLILSKQANLGTICRSELPDMRLLAQCNENTPSFICRPGVDVINTFVLYHSRGFVDMSGDNHPEVKFPYRPCYLA